jgi:hypothetical protein
MTDRSDARVVTVRYADGRGARLEIEPGSEHPEGRFSVTESILRKGGTWKPTGTDDARAVSIERPSDAATRRHLRAALETCDGGDTAFHLRQALQLAEGCAVVR